MEIRPFYEYINDFFFTEYKRTEEIDFSYLEDRFGEIFYDFCFWLFDGGNSWDWASIFPRLSESFMERFWSRLDKKELSKWQKLSWKFIEKHHEDLFLSTLCKFNSMVDEEDKQKIYLKQSSSLWNTL